MFNSDMQKDKIISEISTIELNENRPINISNIEKTIIYSKENENIIEKQIDGGYLDIGLNDTMKDLIVNFIGAVGFSIIGLLYIKDRDGYVFAEQFMPTMKTDEEIKKSKIEQQELEHRIKKRFLKRKS